MRYIWIIALLLLVLIGFEAAAGFVALVLVGGVAFLLVASVCMTINSLVNLKIWDAMKWGAAAAFFAWLARICM